MKCFNLFNSNNPLNNYFFLFFALIFFAIACNRQVNENVESIYEVTKTKNETKPDFELELFKPDTAFEQIGKSLHKNAKSTDEFTKNKTEPDFEIFKPDTTYEQNGKFLSTIISNPYRKVDYIKKGSNGYYKIFFYDINHKMSQEEKLEYVKKIITFNDEFDSLVFLDSHLIGINHKGVKLRNSYVKFTKRYVEVKYINSLDVDVSNIISGKEARNIAINQIKETEDFKFATKEDILKQMEYLRKKNKPIFKSLSYMDTTTTFYIKRYENSYVPVYKFIIYRKTFVIDYVFTINALNGDIIEKKYNGVNSCKQCVNSIVKEADCNTTHPVNILPQVYKTVCNYDPEETYQFENFPDVFGGCSSIKSTFYRCTTFYNIRRYNTAVLIDLDKKIAATKTPDNVYERISLDNTSYTEIEQQQLTAYKNMEIAYDYYLRKVSSEILLERDLKGLEISAGYLKNGVSFANTNTNRIVFTTNDGCLSEVSPMIAMHELTHLVLRRYYKLLPGLKNMPRETRLEEVHGLHESLSDIMAVLAQYDATSTVDWSLFDELGCTSVRKLNDPENSKPAQSISFDKEETSEDPYFWAGITSYWFYLLAEPAFKEVDGVPVGKGIGLERAEYFMFGLLGTIKTFISAGANPATGKPFDDLVDMTEFRDAALITANLLFKADDPEYKICSPEYTTVYRALDAVGLIDGDVTLPCNIINYGGTSFEGCPTAEQYFCSDESGGKSSLTTGLPEDFSNPSDTYWIQVYVDFNGNGKFEEEEFIKDNEVFTNDIVNHKITVGGLPSKNTEIKIIVTNVNALENGNIIGEANLPFVQYFFACNSGCNLITDINNSGYENIMPPVNTGNISINIENDIEICAGTYFCIDYEVNAPAFVNININSDKFTKHIVQSGTTKIGQFCWQPTISDLGTYAFSVLATDEHPFEPLFNIKSINVSVETYSTYGCTCAGVFPEKTVSLNKAVASGHYTALEDLESNGNLYSLADVIFKGGESVSLNNDFYAPASTNFEAYIANCPDFPDPNKGSP